MRNLDRYTFFMKHRYLTDKRFCNNPRFYTDTEEYIYLHGEKIFYRRDKDKPEYKLVSWRDNINFADWLNDIDDLIWVDIVKSIENVKEYILIKIL